MKVVERLNTTAVGSNDEPVQAMRVSDCGPTDSQVFKSASVRMLAWSLPVPHARCFK